MTAFEVRVGETRMITPVIRELSLEPVNGTLPAFSAGSHVQLHLPNGKRNAYSLLSDPSDTSHYRIAVRQQAQSRGGSRYVHEQLQTGDRLRISPPANLFALHSTARLHVLIAAGIGITPFLAYSTELLRRGDAFELHYAYRTGVNDAYVETLRERLGKRLHVYESSSRRLDLGQLLSHRPLGTHVYACGPQSLLDALREQSLALGWPAARVHWEAFAAPEPGVPFIVELARSGRQVAVGAEQSLLEALEDAGVELPNLCRGGVCGQCQTPYLKGDVEHRDLFLAAAERATSLMPCVSRGCGSPILLDI
ncbi:Ferredoxin-NADP reductase [Pseudomonas flavescens]|uniref:Ferredoxin-NADP reductase n=1 Tax=Phytopseudomonas flavescens TaxID=29435 RepID=A0A1G8M2N2_9GAMM|nr:PDR/VanB family oxidoreductase [Pseudomonas flavescens]SDI62188.1 Ferredoxin-NADP reductase [Pseudomonas flavescens]